MYPSLFLSFPLLSLLFVYFIPENLFAAKLVLKRNSCPCLFCKSILDVIIEEISTYPLLITNMFNND